MNESVVVLHVHTYELQLNCCTSIIIVFCHNLFFYGTNKIILLCEDQIEFLFSFVVAVLFLLLPKRSSEGFFSVFEPEEMVIDVIYICKPTKKGIIENSIKEQRSLFDVGKFEQFSIKTDIPEADSALILTEKNKISQHSGKSGCKNKNQKKKTKKRTSLKLGMKLNLTLKT